MNRLSFLLVVALALVPPPFETLKAAPSQGGADVNELIAQLLDSLEQEGIDLADLANDGNENSVDSFDDPADRPGNASPHLKKHGPGKALRLLKKLRSRGSSAGVTRGDFNGDGFADLAIGVPHKDITVNLPFGLGKTLVRDAGEVIVIYGSADGLVATSSTVPDSQVWHQEITGVVGGAGTDDNLGAALAAGDFNGDGFSDLAVGVPGEIGPAGTRVGGVHVFFGSPDGLRAAGNQLFLANDSTQPTFPVLPASGLSLVWADFNGDGFGDLAIEARGQGNLPEVILLLGSTSGLTTAGRKLLTFPSSTGFLTQSGLIVDLVLSAGDFDKDGRADLVVGAPFASVGNVDAAGTVQILSGFSATSPTVFTSSQFLHQSLAGVDEVAEFGDGFGSALAVGDFNGDSFLDLAVGVPHEDNDLRVTDPTGSRIFPNFISDGGVVHVFFGSASGITLANNQLFHKIRGQLFGQQDPEPGDNIGASLAAGDFDGDGFTDLAIGVPGETIGNAAGAGAVEVIYGSATGLGPTSQFWNEGSPGIDSVPTAGDHFGASLSAWNFGRNQLLLAPPTFPPTPGRLVRTADLAIGVPFKNLLNASNSHVTDAGLVRVIYGSVNGLSATPGPLTFSAQVWHLDIPGIPDQLGVGDRFGEALY